MSVRGRLGLDPNQFRITPAAMVLVLLELGLSLVYLLAPEPVRAQLLAWCAASPSTVIENRRVWTLVTTTFLEPSFLGIVLHMLVFWTFAPQLERFWGTRRFLRFVAITMLVANTGGVLFGSFVTGRDVPLTGLDPFIEAAFVAYGITFGRQHVMLMTRWPLTGRQLMWGILAFGALSIVLQGMWEYGAGVVLACGVTVLMVSKWSPLLAWRRRKVARARAKLSVLQGGGPPVKPKRTDDHRFLN